MKTSQILTCVGALTSTVSAFPFAAEFVGTERQAVPDPATGFNPSLQHVPNTGEHKFIAPDLNTQARGPCPGLNAMANHGYLPRNGVATHTQFIQGTNRVFGMGLDLAGFLTVLGGVIDGNGLAWSIGGPNAALPAPVAGLLGTPQGISGSHNKYECDVSPGRGDLYTHGNDFELQMDQYQQLYDMAIANGDNIDLPLLTEFRSKRFDNSIATNPYFFNGPFSGVAVQPAAFTFIYRFMSNKSAEYPAGKLNTDVMNSFFGVVKNKQGKLVKKPGQEKIPDNWYKRAVGDEYTIPFFNGDLVLAALKYPKFLSVGGNLGKTNSFTGVDVKNLTGGAYNLQTLTKGNNAMCFAAQFATQATPDLLRCSGIFKNIQAQASKLNAQFGKSFGSLGCAPIDNPSDDQFKIYPGYSKLNCKTGAY